MKTINESSDQSRQVLMYPSNNKDLLPGTMEEIKISFANDRAPVSKRELHEDTAVAPEPKRLRSAVFICSTPRIASSHSSHSSICTTQVLGKNSEVCAEWDDSLLEPSDCEGDSPLYLTIDDIESLLEDDATGPPGWDSDNDTCKVNPLPLESKDDVEKVSASVFRQLDLFDTLIEESEGDEDYDNYATMAPTPSHSAECPVEFEEPSNSSSACTTKEPPDSLQNKTMLGADYALNIPLLDENNPPMCQPNSACSPNHYLQPSVSYYDIDSVNFTEDSPLYFDHDINNLLATSPGDVTSSEEEWGTKLTTAYKNQKNSLIDSKACLKNSNSLQVPAACFHTQGEDQHLSLSSPNNPDSHKVDPFTEHKTLKKDQSPTTSSVVIPELHLSTDTSGKAQDMKPQISASVGRKNPGSSVPSKGKGKSLAAVKALPRRVLCSFELEENKDRYCDQVRMHLEAPEGESPFQDTHYELASLLHRISKENQNWQHPSNLTRRNHPRSGTKPSKCCSLNQWVAKNGGAKQRFQDMPATFCRSPVPDVLSL